MRRKSQFLRQTWRSYSCFLKEKCPIIRATSAADRAVYRRAGPQESRVVKKLLCRKVEGVSPSVDVFRRQTYQRLTTSNVSTSYDVKCINVLRRQRNQCRRTPNISVPYDAQWISVAIRATGPSRQAWQPRMPTHVDHQSRSMQSLAQDRNLRAPSRRQKLTNR